MTEPLSRVSHGGGLPQDADVPACGPLRDAQRLGELVGRRTRTGLQDLQGTQSPGGGAETGRHAEQTRRLPTEPEADRPELVLT
jgi:hypothetical protein